MSRNSWQRVVRISNIEYWILTSAQSANLYPHVPIRFNCDHELAHLSCCVLSTSLLMRFLKSLKKTWQKASPGISNAQDDDTSSNISHQQSESATPPGPSDPGNAQMNRQELIASTQSPGILTGAHGFIIDRPIMGENQQFQFHYHGTPPPSSREHLQISATPRTSISRGSSNQSMCYTLHSPRS